MPLTPREILAKYIPENAIYYVVPILNEYKVHLDITNERKTKLGDYRSPYNGQPHRISINGNLNKYAFLITLMHELAHLLIFVNYLRQPKPHGTAWKKTFANLLEPLLNDEIFPDDLKTQLCKHLKNPASASGGDIELSRILSKYDSNKSEVWVEHLAENEIFQTENGKVFRKGKKLRKRYKCLCLENNQFYLFHPSVSVIPLSNEIDLQI